MPATATHGSAPGSDRPHYRLPRSARLLSAREFRRVYQRGRRAAGRLMTLVGLCQRRGRGLRLGLSVSKDHGAAVRRNKIKRLLREAFRLERPALSCDCDLVVIPRVLPGKLRLAELRQELVLLIRRLQVEPPGPPRREPQRRGARP
jgi:ribonuclease P protein component